MYLKEQDQFSFLPLFPTFFLFLDGNLEDGWSGTSFHQSSFGWFIHKYLSDSQVCSFIFILFDKYPFSRQSLVGEGVLHRTKKSSVVVKNVNCNVSHFTVCGGASVDRAVPSPELPVKATFSCNYDLRLERKILLLNKFPYFTSLWNRPALNLPLALVSSQLPAWFPYL